MSADGEAAWHSEGAPLRAAPSCDARVVKRRAKGSFLRVVERRGGWVRIAANERRRRAGLWAALSDVEQMAETECPVESVVEVPDDGEEAIFDRSDADSCRSPPAPQHTPRPPAGHPHGTARRARLWCI